jgi:hypothetical protein
MKCVLQPPSQPVVDGGQGASALNSSPEYFLLVKGSGRGSPAFSIFASAKARFAQRHAIVAQLFLVHVTEKIKGDFV